MAIKRRPKNFLKLKKKKLQNNKASKSALQSFVADNEGLNSHSFGEIEFRSFVARSTYSPYISCSPDTAPEVIWKLFFEHWHFTLPNFIISIAGELTRRDTDWNIIMDDTWCITSGSSPSQFPSRSCIVGILRKNSISHNHVFDTEDSQGLFPAVYDRRNRASMRLFCAGDKCAGGRMLDHTHTHFIFVEGTEIQTCDFRAKLLDFIASFCLDHDVSSHDGKTNDVTKNEVAHDKYSKHHENNDVESDHEGNDQDKGNIYDHDNILKTHDHHDHIHGDHDHNHDQNSDDDSTDSDYDEVSDKYENHSETEIPVTIPLVVMLLSDNQRSLMQATRAAMGGHSVVVEQGAKKCFHILSNLKKISDNKSSDNEENPYNLEKKLKFLTRNFNNEDEIDLVTNCFKKWSEQTNMVTLYPYHDVKSLSSAFLWAVVRSKRFDLRSQIQLALAWNRMDVIKKILTSPEQIKHSKFINLYLAMALSFNRVEFIVYLDELGISCTSSLTVKTLWSLYYQALFTDECSTPATQAIKEIVERYPNNPNMLLFNIGKTVCHALTEHQVHGLYHDEMYKYALATAHETASGLTSNVFRVLDLESVHVPHPEFDLFLYCALMGKNELAVLFWKKGSNLTVCALVACAINASIAARIEKTVNDNAAESLEAYSDFWLEMATDFVNHSYNLRKATTVCQLTQKVEILGGCSAISVANACEIPGFFVHIAVQTALDYIWYGGTKQHKSNFKTFLCIVNPWVIPWMHMIDRTDPLTADFVVNCHSKFTEVHVREKNTKTDVEGICRIIPALERMEINEHGDYVHTDSIRNKVAFALKDIHNFLDSPKIKFFVNSALLLTVIFLQCFCLLATEVHSITDSPILMSFTVFIASYMFGLLIEEIMEIAAIPEEAILKKFGHWQEDIWNKLDFVKIICYFSGQGIMWSGANDDGLWYAGKILLCIATFVLYLRVFQMYLVFRFLGPKVYMMSRMLKDLMAFLSIMVLVFLSYGTILTVLTNEPYRPRSIELEVNSVSDIFFIGYNNILRIPYWQLYDNAMGNATHVRPTYPGLMRSMLTGFYMLFSNILMLNLLIAMFSYTFEVVQEQSHMFWCYHRLDVIEEYSEKSWIPSPFVILEYLVLIVQKMFGKGRRITSPFKKSLPREYEGILAEFETEVMEHLELHEREEKIHNVTMEGLKKQLDTLQKTMDESLGQKNNKI